MSQKILPISNSNSFSLDQPWKGFILQNKKEIDSISKLQVGKKVDCLWFGDIQYVWNIEFQLSTSSDFYSL